MNDYKTIALILLKRAGGEVKISGHELREIHVRGRDMSLESYMMLANDQLVVRMQDPHAPIEVEIVEVSDGHGRAISGQLLLPGDA